MSRFSISLLPVGTAILLCAFISFTFVVPPAFAADEGFADDIAMIMTDLPEQHFNFFSNVTEEDFYAAADALLENLPDMSNAEVTVGMMKLVAMAGDSHTTLDISNAGFGMFPLWLYKFEDGLFVTDAGADYTKTLKAKIIAIDGTPVDTVWNKVATVVSHENDAQLKNQVPNFLILSELIYVLGISKAPDHAVFTFEGAGGRFDLDVKSTKDARNIDWKSAVGDNEPVPWYRSQPENPYFMKYDGDLGMFYLQYNACVENEDLPFAEFTNLVLDAVNKTDFNYFVFDLRMNGGGNSAIADPLIDALAANTAVNQRGKLFVVIGRRTFSSAILNALSFKNKTNAIFVGEPTGGKPNHFGEIKSLTLPYSGLTVNYSTKYFEQSNVDTDSLIPDMTVAPTSADYFAGRDPVLDKIVGG